MCQLPWRFPSIAHPQSQGNLSEAAGQPACGIRTCDGDRAFTKSPFFSTNSLDVWGKSQREEEGSLCLPSVPLERSSVGSLSTSWGFSLVGCDNGYKPDYLKGVHWPQSHPFVLINSNAHFKERPLPDIPEEILVFWFLKFFCCVSCIYD